MCDGVLFFFYEREWMLVNFFWRKGLDVLYILKGCFGGVKIVIMLYVVKLGRVYVGSKVIKLWKYYM